MASNIEIEEEEVRSWQIFTAGHRRRNRTMAAIIDRSFNISLASDVVERMGRTTRVILLFDAVTQVVGIRAAKAPAPPHAVAVHKAPATNSYRIHALPFCRAFDIRDAVYDAPVTFEGDVAVFALSGERIVEDVEV